MFETHQPVYIIIVDYLVIYHQNGYDNDWDDDIMVNYIIITIE